MPPEFKSQIPPAPKPMLRNIKDYHDKNYVDAKQLLNKLFQTNNFSDRLGRESEIRVLVPCAGSFPGYLPFLEKLREQFPNLKAVSLTLVDPVFADKNELSACREFLADRKDLKVTISFVASDLAKFTENYHSDRFDIIYFEHPVVSGVATFLSQWDVVPMLSRAIPLLANIAKPDAAIIAICKTLEEQFQMQHLLSYSLGLQSNSVSIAWNLVIPRNYCKGLFGKVPLLSDRKAEEKSVNAKVKQIVHSEKLLAVFFLLSSFIYSLRFGNTALFWEQSASLILMFAQFALHRPDPNGLGIKVLIVAAQLALLCRDGNANNMPQVNASTPRSGLS